MTRDEILALYQWTPGDCFRCPRADVPTTLLHEIDPPAGGHYEVRACQECVLGLEAERLQAAKAAGREYVPGRLAA